MNLIPALIHDTGYTLIPRLIEGASLGTRLRSQFYLGGSTDVPYAVLASWVTKYRKNPSWLKTEKLYTLVKLARLLGDMDPKSIESNKYFKLMFQDILQIISDRDDEDKDLRLLVLRQHILLSHIFTTSFIDRVPYALPKLLDVAKKSKMYLYIRLPSLYTWSMLAPEWYNTKLKPHLTDDTLLLKGASHSAAGSVLPENVEGYLNFVKANFSEDVWESDCYSLIAEGDLTLPITNPHRLLSLDRKIRRNYSSFTRLLFDTLPSNLNPYDVPFKTYDNLKEVLKLLTIVEHLGVLCALPEDIALDVMVNSWDSSRKVKATQKIVSILHALPTSLLDLVPLSVVLWLDVRRKGMAPSVWLDVKPLLETIVSGTPLILEV